MNTKKSPERFSIKFNPNDSTHQFVIDLLNQLSPRKKAQFITNAIYHYTHCSNPAGTVQAAPVGYETIENIVLDILKKQQRTMQSEATSKVSSPSIISSCPPVEINLKNNPASQDMTTEQDTISTIFNTLSAFRSQ